MWLLWSSEGNLLLVAGFLKLMLLVVKHEGFWDVSDSVPIAADLVNQLNAIFWDNCGYGFNL